LESSPLKRRHVFVSLDSAILATTRKCLNTLELFILGSKIGARELVMDVVIPLSEVLLNEMDRRLSAFDITKMKVWYAKRGLRRIRWI
jgi:hypothetical protein